MPRPPHPDPDFDGEAAFNDASEIVPSVGFDYAAVDHEPDSRDDGARPSREIVVRLLNLLTDGNPRPSEVGRRVLLLQHMLNAEGSQRRLAARMGLAESRVSERLAAMRHTLSSGSF